MEIGDRLVETRLVHTELFDQEIWICRRDLAVCERTITGILRRELSNRSSRLPKQLEAKFADVSSVLRPSGEVCASPLAFPPHFKPANSSPFNLTVNQTSIRMDVLETSIQDSINVDFPLSPPGGIPNHAAVPWNFPCQWLRVDEVLVGVSLWPGGCVLSTSVGEFSHALSQWPDFPVGHVPLATLTASDGSLPLVLL
jgi:hypothetical protein